MKISSKSNRFVSYLFLLFFVLAMISCGTISSLVTTPTATLPAKVDSSLMPKLVGQWNVSGSAPWNEVTLTFNDDESLGVVGLDESPLMGSYFFTSENEIAYILPSEQGSMALEFLNEDSISLIITESNNVFGIIASAERAE